MIAGNPSYRSGDVGMLAPIDGMEAMISTRFP